MLIQFIKAYFLSGIFLYAILTIWFGNYELINILNITAFATYVVVLKASYNKRYNNFSAKDLFCVVFAYSFCYVSLYLLLSDFYNGNTFLFSESDARAYERYSFRLLDLPMNEWTAYLEKHKWGFDDYGAPITLSLFLHILPSKLFVNFCYVLLNSIGAVLLFKIGEMIMLKKYAYIAALTYGTASYSIFFMGSYLKEEIMVFILILCFYYLYLYIKTKTIRFLFFGGITSLSLLFFRVPVALLLWASYGVMLIMEKKKKTKMGLIILIASLVVFLAFGIIVDNYNRYANGGNITETYVYMTYSKTQKLVLYLGALIGPFPQLFHTGGNITFKSIYGSGLLFKLFLVYPFWRGFFYCINRGNAKLYPLYTFIILEMIALGIVLDSLELRKVLPHVPFFILAAFWFISNYDDEDDDEIRQMPIYKRIRREAFLSSIAFFSIALVWNMFKS